jgi:alkanesulfonate monooxygenase SsuD/methylene tetrahydromethanopterin reductase-like flavin-dependent oxidoreductase (luciferase family)
MEIGIQFSQPAIRPTPVASMQGYLDLIELSHKMGFKSFWAGQHFMSGEFLLFQPLTLLARASASVPGMKMGTSVILLPILNPLEVAEHGATLDAMTDGKFILGVGLGYRDPELAGSGITRAEVIPRFEESVAVIKELWENESADYEGRHFNLRNARINPKPTQKPRPPLLIGAYAEPAVKRAGRISDGWIIPPELFGDLLQKRLGTYRDAMESRGLKGTLAIMRAFHVTEDHQQATSILDLLGQHFRKKRQWGVKKGGDVAEVSPADEANQAAIVGDLDTCIRKIETVRETFEPDHLILLMGVRGVDEESLRRSINIAGEKILPRFQG